MAKLGEPRYATDAEQRYRYLVEYLREVRQQSNQQGEGRIVARHNAVATKPTTGSFQQGDITWNLTPSEAGTAGSKYVILGWVCTVAGSPGTLLDMRVLTGN